MANLKRVLVSLVGALALAGIGVAPAASLELPPLPTVPGLPIPSLPTDLLVPKSFGGADGHKYVNGVLDKLAAKIRPLEVEARRQQRPRG